MVLISLKALCSMRAAASSLLDADKKQQNHSRQQGYVNKPMHQRAAGGTG